VKINCLVIRVLCAGISDEERQSVRHNLIAGRDFAGVFLAAKQRSIALLEEAWICFLKQDFKNYFESVKVQILFEILTVVDSTCCLLE